MTKHVYPSLIMYFISLLPHVYMDSSEQYPRGFRVLPAGHIIYPGLLKKMVQELQDVFPVSAAFSRNVYLAHQGGEMEHGIHFFNAVFLSP